LDDIPLTRNVMFIGDYFTMIVTATLDESDRLPGESDEDFAVRWASMSFFIHYGWNVAEASNEIGVMDEDS
jgi:hypothetical protein